MRTPPSFRGELPELPDRPQPTATLHFTRANGDRRSLVIEARDGRTLADMIGARIADLRAAGNRIVKTEIKAEDGEYTYEYNSVGQVENIFRNGDLTP